MVVSDYIRSMCWYHRFLGLHCDGWTASSQRLRRGSDEYSLSVLGRFHEEPRGGLAG